jgi:hypothetical protein
VSGKNFDHRRQWIDDELKNLAGAMGIDLLGISIKSLPISLCQDPTFGRGSRC